jgi:hypothetical protein
VKIFWWQAGLHFEPENQSDFELLQNISASLDVVEIGQKVITGPIRGSDFRDEKPVVGVDKLSQVVS